MAYGAQDYPTHGQTLFDLLSLNKQFASNNGPAYFLRQASAARPDGSMEVVRVYWWEHSCRDGQYSSAKVHRLLKVQPKANADAPASADDYDIVLEELPGLACEVIEGM